MNFTSTTYFSPQLFSLHEIMCPFDSFLFCFSLPLEYVSLAQKLCCARHIVGTQLVSCVNEGPKHLLQGCHACCVCRVHDMSHALQPCIRIMSGVCYSSGSGASRRHKLCLFCRLSVLEGILKTIPVLSPQSTATSNFPDTKLSLFTLVRWLPHYTASVNQRRELTSLDSMSSIPPWCSCPQPLCFTQCLSLLPMFQTHFVKQTNQFWLDTMLQEFC